MNHDRLNDYICKLKILSKLEPREKIIIHERTIEIVDYTTYNLARVKKAINLENKWHMIVKLEAMYHDIESIIDNLVNNPPNRTPEQDVLFALDRLRHDLDGSLQGLHNLILTYNTNKSATSRLETLYEDVKILSQKINKFFEQKNSGKVSYGIVDRKNYGVENIYEDSKKVKKINEFDPDKPELQVPSSSTRTLHKISQVSNVPKVPSSEIKLAGPPLPPQDFTDFAENDDEVDDDDTFSTESPIDPKGPSLVDPSDQEPLLGLRSSNPEDDLMTPNKQNPNKNGKRNRRNRRR